MLPQAGAEVAEAEGSEISLRSRPLTPGSLGHGLPLALPSWSLALGSKANLLSSPSVQDINISLWRLPEEVKYDKSVFMNQGEWELLAVLTQFRKFSMESSDCYAEMKFYVSGKGCG